MIKKIGFAVVMSLSILFIFNLVGQTNTALQAGSRLDSAADELARLQDQNRQLRQKLAQTQTLDFIEEQARNKLNLVKPNETIVIIPPELITTQLEQNKPVVTPKLANWQGWLKLFL